MFLFFLKHHIYVLLLHPISRRANILYYNGPSFHTEIRLIEGGDVTLKFSKGIFVVLVRTEKTWRSYVVIYGFKYKAYHSPLQFYAQSAVYYNVFIIKWRI